MQSSKRKLIAAQSKISLILLLVILGVGAFFIFRESSTESGGIDQVQEKQEIRVSDDFVRGQSAPEVTFVDFDGNSHRLADYLGKPVVIDFWAKWCPFCVEEMPELQKSHEKYGDDLVLIGVHRTDTESLKIGKEFAAGRGVTYLLGTDPRGDIYNAAGGFGMPVAIFIDSEGMVVEIKSGPKTAEEIAEKVTNLINGN